MTRQRSNFNFVQKEFQKHLGDSTLLHNYSWLQDFPAQITKDAVLQMTQVFAIVTLQVHGAKNGSRFCLHPLCFATPSQSCARVSSVSTLRPRCKPILSKHFRHQLIDGPGSPGGHKRPHSTWQHFNLPPLLVIDVTQQTLLDPPHTHRDFQKPPTPLALQKKLRSCASGGS